MKNCTQNFTEVYSKLTGLYNHKMNINDFLGENRVVRFLGQNGPEMDPK